jgi:hypothetical protein
MALAIPQDQVVVTVSLMVAEDLPQGWSSLEDLLTPQAKP